MGSRMRVESPRFTPFRGHAAQLARLTRALRAATPLITVTGPVGIGKTRLVAHAVPPSAVWIDASTFTSVDDVDTISEHEALAAVRGTRTHTGTRLVVLDGVDAPVLEQALADYLDRHPKLQLVVTRRSPLHVRGETSIRLSPLAVPGRVTSLIARPGDFPAVACFLDHASRAEPTFVLDHATAEATLQVLITTGGIPLAIELAARWLNTITIHELAARCDRPSELLAAAATDLAPAHRELFETIRQSLDHLEADASTLAHAISLFATSATVGEISAVLDASVRLTDLTHLVDLGLVTAETTGTSTMFGMPAVIAGVASERVPAPLRERHRAWLLDTIRNQAPLVGTDRTASALDTIGRHVDTMPSLVDCYPPEIAAELALELEDYWFETGQSSRGIHHTRAVAHALRSDHPLAPWVELLSIRLHLYAGHVEHAAQSVELMGTGVDVRGAVDPGLEAETAYAEILVARYRQRTDFGDLIERCRRLMLQLPVDHGVPAVNHRLQALPARIELALADLLRSTSQVEPAIAHTRRHIERASHAEASGELAQWYWLLGDLNAVLGDFDEALGAYRHGYQLAGTFGRRSTSLAYMARCWPSAT